MNGFLDTVGAASSPHPIQLPIAELIRLLACDKRLEMLVALSTRPLRVDELARCLNYDPTDMSKHLKQLRSSGLVHEERAGHAHPHRLSRGVVVRLEEDRRLSIQAMTHRSEEVIIRKCPDSLILRLLTEGVAQPTSRRPVHP